MDGVSGVAVLPLLPDGKIVLNLNFRHATRSWEWELPRGGLLANETEEEAVRRELEEETGWRAGEIERLGEIAPDSGCLGYTVPIYWVIPVPEFASRNSMSKRPKIGVGVIALK